MEKMENDVEIVGVRQDDSNCRKGVNCAYYGEHFNVYWRSVAWRVLCMVSAKTTTNNQRPLRIGEHGHTIVILKIA